MRLSLKLQPIWCAQVLALDCALSTNCWQMLLVELVVDTIRWGCLFGALTLTLICAVVMELSCTVLVFDPKGFVLEEAIILPEVYTYIGSPYVGWLMGSLHARVCDPTPRFHQKSLCTNSCTLSYTYHSVRRHTTAGRMLAPKRQRHGQMEVKSTVVQASNQKVRLCRFDAVLMTICHKRNRKPQITPSLVQVHAVDTMARSQRTTLKW